MFPCTQTESERERARASESESESERARASERERAIYNMIFEIHEQHPPLKRESETARHADTQTDRHRVLREC